jgi:hypothetical protein
MNDQDLMDAYADYSLEQTRRGIISHELDTLILDGLTVEAAIRKILTDAGRWPVEGVHDRH